MWTSKHGDFSISVKDADQLFYEYSRHGLDMSSTQVRLKYNIPLKMWFSLKYHLELYKDSHIISPYTLENTPEDKIRELVLHKMQLKEKDKERVIVEEHNKATINEYNKVIKDFKTKDLAIEKMLDALVDSITIPKIKFQTINPVVSSAPSHIVAVVADLHIGAEVKDLLGTPDYNYKILRKRLDAVAQEINALNAEKVTLLLMGDTIESATGLNHITTWQDMEDGAYGEKVFKMAVEALIEFFNKIVNLYDVFGISGNHDRLTPNRKEDPYNSLSGMIFYTLKKIYIETLPIYHHYLLQSVVIDDISYLAVHGDKNVLKRKNLGLEGVLKYGNPNHFNIVLSAHLHHRDIIADHDRYRWIRCPGIFTANRWEEDNGFGARPGFLIIYNNHFTSNPVVMDYTIK